MRRQLQTSTSAIHDQVTHSARDKTRRAYLVTPYRDKTLYVLIQFSDPRNGSRGTTVKARISPGAWGLDTVPPNLDVGYPVTVVVRRGQVTVVGF